MTNAVTEENIRAVLDGFKDYIENAKQAQAFDVIGLKNFMEPIFERAGYRDPVPNGGGVGGRL
ncbi:MAG: hypothetical protein IJU71_07505 [Selenomonadaceae bacterium]|nr:hypothetical protein [Selenomonadaceae bacterium]